MHSAEHILNQAMDRLYGCGRCFNAHVEKKKSKCDYHFDHALTDAEISEIEDRVNEVIQVDMPVTEDFMALEDAGSKYNLGKLPADVAGDVRIVKIGAYDACPCIGLHVEHTRQIGQFKITSTSFENDVLDDANELIIGTL